MDVRAPGTVGIGRAFACTVGVIVGAVVGGGVLVEMADAAGCSVETERVRGAEVYASALPDCRAYEQVSPTGDKDGLDAAGNAGFVQASGSGEKITSFSDAPFADTEGAAVISTTYLSSRSPADWSTSGLLPAVPPGALESVLGLTGDLERAIVVVKDAGVSNAYVYDSTTHGYQILAENIGKEQLYFVDATLGGSRILFETNERLPVSGGIQPVSNGSHLYEWDESKAVSERLNLVGVVPSVGERCGPSGPACEASGSGSVAGPSGGSAGSFYHQNTISTDGSRAVFTDLASGRVYIREPMVESTVQVSAGPAVWQAGTPDGAYVFYTEGNELYRYDANSSAREQLTVGAERLSGTLGVSNDGTYAYFVASGAELTTVPAEENSNGEMAVKGAENLYEWHEDPETHTSAITFIARLLSQDSSDWRNQNESTVASSGVDGGERSSRVTPSGGTILFSSMSPLTGYDNGSTCEQSARPCYELFRYEAGTKRLGCVSCNPGKAEAKASAFLVAEDDVNVSPAKRDAFVTRNLSEDGDRVFFNTAESLAGGTNGKTNVYEWEHEGTGSCLVGDGNGSSGCVYLISTGQANGRSLFGDASADGRDVFFFTRQSLVGQDRDDNVDLYDARENGGILAQNPQAPPEPCTAESCRSALSVPPSFGVLSSTALTGVGNIVQLPPPQIPPHVKKCPHHEKLKHNKCVKAKVKKKKSGARKAKAGRRGM